MNNLVEMIEDLQHEMRANRQYSCADKLDAILEEAKKDGWTPVEEQPYPEDDGVYDVSGVYEYRDSQNFRYTKRIVGEADFIDGKWLIANDFTLEAWRPKLQPYMVGE